MHLDDIPVHTIKRSVLEIVKIDVQSPLPIMILFNDVLSQSFLNPSGSFHSTFSAAKDKRFTMTLDFA